MAEVKVPDIGDFDEVPVIEILVSVGDTVEADEGLVTLESDKATMDVPAPEAGTIDEILVEVGDKVSEGTAIVKMSGGDGGGDEDEASEDESEDAGDGDEEALKADVEEKDEDGDGEDGGPDSGSSGDGTEGGPQPTSGGPVYASPSVRRLAREKGIDLSKVEGSGRKGRITVEDVEQGETKSSGGEAAKGASIEGLDMAPWPQVDHAKYGEVERVELSRIKQISGPNLARNWVYIPHVTHQDEADITELEAFRKQINSEQDVKVTMVALLLKACVPVLEEYPEFNSSLDGDSLILKRYYHLGFAADTPQGLLVPVIRDVDKKGLLEIADELIELSGKAREGKLGPAEMAGATFTISSLGGIGGTGFTPIVNAPQVAILGVTRSAMKPVWKADAGEFVPRLMVPLSLSYDHRVVDGAAAARFCVALVKVLEDFRRILL
jgi:pyruvate dehydrogenase E2 component (dihydrolipoamide acetyltransferase)